MLKPVRTLPIPRQGYVIFYRKIIIFKLRFLKYLGWGTIQDW
jgi:hypothetical protein